MVETPEQTRTALEQALRAPSPAAWERIGQLLHRARPAHREELVQMAEAGLTHWPDELRSATMNEIALPGRGWFRVGPGSSDGSVPRLLRTLELCFEDIPYVKPRSALVRHGFPALRRLDIYGEIKPPGNDAAERFLSVIAKLPALEEIHFRHLSAGNFENAVAFSGFWQCLFKGLRGPNIQRLDLQHKLLSPPVVEALLSSPAAPALTHLDLTNCLHSEAHRLAAWPTGGRLRALDVTANGVDTRCLEAWCGSPLLERLEVLSLFTNPVRVEGLEALSRDARTSNIRALNLSGCPIGIEEMHVLSEHPSYRSVEDLRLAFCGLNEAITEYLVAGPLRQRLRVLDLTHEQVDDDFARAVTALPPPPRLVRLHLAHNLFTNEGLALLRAWQGAPQSLIDSLLTEPPPVLEESWASRRDV